MMSLLILSILLAVSFVGIAIWKLKAIPESISSLVYVFKWPWLWTVWLWVVTILMAPTLIESLPETWQSLGFLTIACLMFCGAMPIFMKEHKKAHDILGIAGGVLSQVCVLIINPWWLIIWVLMLAAIWMKEKAVFISESLCMIGLYGSLLTTF